MQKDGINEKIQRQLELENEMLVLGAKRYREQVRTARLADLPPGDRLLRAAMEPLVQAINDFKRPSPGGGRLVDTKKFLRQLDTDEIAYITALRLINSLSTAEPVQHVAVGLASMLKDHLEYLKFKEEAPRYLYKVEENLETSTQVHARRVIMRAKRMIGVEDETWTEVDRLHIGVKLIDLFIESTGLVEKIVGPEGSFLLQPTEQTKEWLEIQHARCELLFPVYLPMVVPPKSWDSPFGGGYIANQATLRHKLVKTQNNAALEELAEVDMPQVYKAINAVQNTAWRINKKVLEIMAALWNSGAEVAGLPPSEEEPLPPKPWTTDEEAERLKVEQPEAFEKWKKTATTVYDRRIRTRSKRFVVIQRLWVANKFKDEPKICFPWNLDFRGRLYPIPSFINPQEEDAGKALLEFAEGLPLGERGAYWLAIQLANKYGEDKVSFDDRVQWTHEREGLILDSAENPLDGQQFWMEADDPFMFLAACFEWAGYRKEGPSFKSHLAIALDGSCNGLQNFSAMLRDEVGAKAVNLLPSEKPQDVYQEVADLASKMVARDAADGNEWAKLWVGKIDRGIAKRNVMTTPYGVKKYGMKQQLMEELKKRDEKSPERYLDTDDYFKPAVYLAEVMHKSIGEVVIAARSAMDWLQEAAKIASKAEVPITWTTPAGFLVHQEYLKANTKQIATFWGGMKVKLSLSLDTDKINKRKQGSGISPNYVHSMDASHLMLSVNKCVDRGITAFSLIHDSYGTHAANTDLLSTLLREAFIEQYTPDVLQQFRDELAATVANAGGIGTIAETGLTLDELSEEINKARTITGGYGYIGVNVLFAITQFADLVKRAMQEKVDFIVSGAGFSRDMFDWGKEYGIPVIPVVSSARLAKLAEKLGAAAVVVEGKEAGGHLGTDRSVKEILPEVASAVDIPIVAAGGITDGKGIAEVIEMGASGAQLATRFVLSEECEAHQNFKQMYLSANQEDVVLIQSPVGLPGRALRNQFTELISQGKSQIKKCDKCLKRFSAKFCILDVLKKSVTGDTVNGLVFSGENVYKLKNILPVREIMDNLAAELDAALA